jgi:hypothetical protein
VRTIAWITLAYLACLVAATYPRILSLGSRLPTVPDPMTVLWALRWYRTCLLEGRSVFFLPDIQAPVGAPLGLIPPLHLQALMYIPMSLVIANDILCYNLIWVIELVTTGLGTFALAWYVTRSVPAAFVGGLLAMLSGPVLMHAHGHIELMALGFVPLFILAWMRLIDAPSPGRLAAAAGLYLLVVMSAAYFAILAVAPAVLYALGALLRRRQWAWFLNRLAWLSGFVAISLPCVALLFICQIWVARNGQAMTRPRAEFVSYGSPPWSYVIPTREHFLHRALPADFYAAAKVPIVECSSYLGLVAIGLLLYAALVRAEIPRRAYWWTGLAVLALLSFGAYLKVGSTRVALPALWLWDLAPPFKTIRVPARFNLFAAIFAAVLAAAGLRHGLSRVRRPAARGAIVAALVLVAVADLAIVPFPGVSVPAMPACYAMIRRRDPSALILELPQFPSSAAAELNAMAAYWQSIHGGRTTAGYGAHANERFDDLLGFTTPFNAFDLVHPAFLGSPDKGSVTINTNLPMADYAWLYLTSLGIDYVVLHRWSGSTSGLPIPFEALEAILRPALIYEDRDTLVFERAKLPEPSSPVMICGEGWRRLFFWRRRLARVIDRTAEVTVYSSSPARPFAIYLEAAALRSARTVRLREGDRVLAEWKVPADALTVVSSPPIWLSRGLHTLVLESDRDERPRRRRELPAQGDTRPYSLRVVQVSLIAAPATAELDRDRRFD